MFRKLIAALIGLMCLLPAQGMEFSKRFVDKIHYYNLLATCWGSDNIDAMAYEQEKTMIACGVYNKTEKTTESPAAASLPAPLPVLNSNLVFRTIPMYSNVQAGFYNPYAALGRRKRQAVAEHEAMEPTSDADLAEYQTMFEDKVEKLTCLLRKLGMLDADNNIVADLITPESLEEYSNTPAGQDPAFLRKYAAEMRSCYDIAMAFPQTALDRNDFMAEHGRKMIYFKCMKQCEIDMCLKFQMAQYIETTSQEPLDPAKYGAKDKYDAAAMVAKVMEATASDTAKHIDAFFWGTPETMFDM